jgi:hypothetical protein
MIKSYKLLLGNRLIKSIPIDSHGLPGIGRLCNKLRGFLLDDFVIWHSLHVSQNAMVSLTIIGHQNHHQIWFNVLLGPK